MMVGQTINSTIESSEKAIECHYHDGGPDHNVRHVRNKLSNIAYFLRRDLDMLITVQTPPSHSWKNPVERCMSILNLGLQSVGIMREETENYEQLLKSANSLTAIRKLAEEDPAVEEEVIASVQPMIEMLEKIFMRLTLGENHLQTFKAVSSDVLNDSVDILKRIDPHFDPLTILDSKKSLKHISAELTLFINKHCVERHYMFSIKKCEDVDCICGPIRLHQSNFEQLHHLPSPINAEKYISFSKAYGRKVTDVPDKHLPSPWVQNKDHGMPFLPSTQSAKKHEVGDQL